MANEFITDEHTDALTELVQEVVNDPSTYYGSTYLPSVTLAMRKIRVEVLEATGGLTNEIVIGTQPKYLQKGGSHVIEFEPPAYAEGVHFDVREILYLRELGQNDRSKRGIRAYIDRNVDRLNRRMEARMELLRWQTLLNGGYTVLGQTLSFGIPTANRALPLGQNWSSDGIAANNSSNPIIDLRYWLLGGLAVFRKYKIKEVVMNPNTARWILDNSNVQTLIQYHFGSEKYEVHDVPGLLKFLIPGMPPVVIYDGWYQTELVSGALASPARQITVSDATYFMPDGYIFFPIKPYPGGEKLGEMVQSINLSNGSIDNPGVGKFLVVEDCTAPGTKGGPSNPFMDIWAGFYGAPKLDLPQNVLTGKVIA